MKGYITCIDCGKEVERTGYRQMRCTDCSRLEKVNWKRRWRSENPEADSEYRANYRASNRAVLRERSREYEAANREARREAARKRRSASSVGAAVVGRKQNIESARNYNRRWRKENPEREASYKRKAKTRDISVATDRKYGRWTPAEDAVVLSWTGGDRELGAVLGRTRNAVGQRRRDLRKRAAGQAANEGADS